MLLRVLIFLFLNFAALGVGGLFTNVGVNSEWYANLNKAPWTPPGWVFGFAWTTIMICFSIYLAYLWPQVKTKFGLIVLFTIQWILNVAWNPLFFHYHQTGLSLVVISILTVVVGVFLFQYWPTVKWLTLLLLPYAIWMLIATSLNAYAVYAN